MQHSKGGVSPTAYLRVVLIKVKLLEVPDV